MTNAELLAKIKAEIERRLKKYATDVTMPLEALGKVILELKGILSFLSTLESEKPINPEDAMKLLDEKIALVKQRGSWDGVDVDKFMDEVRGREPEKPVPNDLDFEQELYHHFGQIKDFTLGMRIGQYFYNLGRDSVPLPEDTVLFNKGVAEGRRLESEENKDRDIVFWRGIQYAREMMMKEAVEGEITKDNRGNNVVRVGVFNEDFEYGDKIRIIVLSKKD